MNCFKTIFFSAILWAFSLRGQINPTVISSSGNFSVTCTTPTLTLTAGTSFTGPVSYTWTTPQPSIVIANSISVAAPGIFSLSASSGTILETTTVSIVINTVQPTVTLTALSNSITCSTPTILMNTASNPSNVSYAWVEPGVGFGCTSSTCIAAQAGTYSVTVKDLVNGCQKTTTLNIGDNRVYPVFNSVGLYTVACPNGTVSLEPTVITGTAGMSFQWTIPAGAVTSATNSLALITNAAGQYTITAINTVNGCATNTLVSVFACVGLYENTQDLKLFGYPNPVSTVFKIDSQLSDFQVHVMGCFGQVLVLSSKESTLDFSALQPGLYYVKVSSAKGIGVLKVIKE